MKLRLGSPNLAALLHRPTRSGLFWRSHEGVLRVIQLVVMVVVALFCAKMIAWVALLAFRAIGGFMS